MPLLHEFGILDDFDTQKKYVDYTPQKYNCIAVDDEIINELHEDFSLMKTYFHSYSRPDQGLAYYGITIIPQESLSLFYNIVTSSRHFKHSIELSELASKIIQATKEEKQMIHFGV